MKVREPRPGEIIGRNYIIESELGRGGFGVVFKARHVDIDRVVALKVLLVTYARKDPSAVDRFRREATIAAALNYPNTVRVFDYGETDEGVFYIIMEFIEGKDLTHIIAREGRVGVRRAVHIVRQVLHAMMEAHSRGIVHRDIKPDNIMIVPIGYDPDFVKVMDFGIAKMAHGGQTLTQAGLTLGTPRYMPVEQLKGATLTPAADLYAVGLVFYEMLMGQPAFEGETAVDVAVNVMESPSLTVPDDPRIPRPVAAIIERACAKDALDRYQSAREFLNAINQLDPIHLDIDPKEEHLDPKLDPPRGRFGGPAPTRILPGVDGVVPEGGDFEDAIRTLALRVGEGDAPPRPVEDATEPGFHEQATLAMPVLDATQVAAAIREAEAGEGRSPDDTSLEPAVGRVREVTSPVVVPKEQQRETSTGADARAAALGKAAAEGMLAALRKPAQVMLGVQLATLVLVLFLLFRVLG